MNYITYLIINNKNEKLHYNDEKGFYLDQKIHYDELLTFCTKSDAFKKVSELNRRFVEPTNFSNLKVEIFFEVDDVLAPLNDIADFVSLNWDGERINDDDEE